MKQRSKLRLLMYFGFGAFSSVALMTGANVYAFSLSPEELIRRSLDAILSYVIGDAYETFKETVKNFTEKMNELYGDEGDDASKKAAADGMLTENANNVQQTIYNSKALAESIPTESACSPGSGKSTCVVEAASNEQARHDVRRKLQFVQVNAENNQHGSDAQQGNTRTLNEQKAAKAKSVLSNMQSKSGALPNELDGTYFLTRQGYVNEQHYSDARAFVDRFANVALSERLNLADLIIDNPAVSAAVVTESELYADISYASNALYQLLWDRRRDKGALDRLQSDLSPSETELLANHALNSGVSKIDIYNFEADTAAHNTKMITDILNVGTQNESAGVMPTATRAYKYVVRQKALQNKFDARLVEQNAVISSLMAILTKQLVRDGV